MLHTIIKGLEICIHINIEICEVDYYTWIFFFLWIILLLGSLDLL